MDLTKTTLDIVKIDQFINQSEKQDIFLYDTFDSQKNHKSIKEQCGNYDLSNEIRRLSNYHKVESSDDKQNTILVNYKHLKTTQINNSESRIDNATVQNVDMLPNINVNQVLKTAKTRSNSVGELNKSFDFYSKLNVWDKKMLTEESNNENIMKSSDSTKYLDKTEKNIESLVGFQEEKKIIDEMETTKKIAETIATSSKNSDENNPKRKKKLQILLSRNHILQNWDSCDNNSECVKPSIPSIHINTDTDHTNKKAMNDKKIKNKKYFTETQKPFDDFQIKIGATKIQNNDMTEEHVLEKRRFEEIEDKLEEMFAGIEEEQLVNTTTDEKHMPKNSSNSLNKFVNDNCNETYLGFNNELYIDNSLKFDTSATNNSSLLIKAAKKPSLCAAGNKKQINLLFRDHKNPSIPKSKLYLKTMTPQRRLSIGISKELLKFSVKTCNEKNEKKSINCNTTGEEPMTPISLNFKTRRGAKKIKKNVPKNKIKKNSERKRSKYKKEITETTIINTKQIRQKIKQTRMQSLSSENDTEEKQVQTRDIDIKNRSPFVLVKSNGSIAVINTVTPDDSNERVTRKPSSYVYERKTVKGCYSSTLSNKYDADTADSSWKCVFCKIGPHKKQLGDLFGPYIISSNCDEYRTTKDYIEKFLKVQKNDAQFLYLSNKSLKFVNETSNSNIQNISKSNYEQLININALGMSQVSSDCYEIWVHEECAIWAPNIFVVGSRLAGLEEASWSCMRYECAYCLKQGAFLCCLQRDCKIACHVPCALESKWLLDESKFWVYCSKHALNEFLNKN